MVVRKEGEEKLGSVNLSVNLRIFSLLGPVVGPAEIGPGNGRIKFEALCMYMSKFDELVGL